ncbi:hypothetical protein [Polaromonas aquatica]|uniref:hypothetical protein n=1 Tax=Polaromonas aquatica TaxID=332657 RepID=UPI003D645AA3
MKSLESEALLHIEAAAVLKLRIDAFDEHEISLQSGVVDAELASQVREALMELRAGLDCLKNEVSVREGLAQPLDMAAESWLADLYALTDGGGREVLISPHTVEVQMQKQDDGTRSLRIPGPAGRTVPLTAPMLLSANLADDAAVAGTATYLAASTEGRDELFSFLERCLTGSRSLMAAFSARAADR